MRTISAPSSNRSRIAVAAGTSPSRAPHSSMGRLLVISVERLRCRRTMISTNASAPLGGKLFMPKSSRHSRSGFKYRASVRRASAGFGSAFSTAKHALEYPGRFLDDREAVTYFIRYFNLHDTEHCHSGIDFVTPQKANNGQRQAIGGDRRTKAFSPHRRCREENQQKSGMQKTKNQGTLISQNSVA